MAKLPGSSKRERLEVFAAPPPPLGQGIIVAAAARTAVFKELRVVTLERRAPSVQAGGGVPSMSGLCSGGVYRDEANGCVFDSALRARRGMALPLALLGSRREGGPTAQHTG